MDWWIGPSRPWCDKRNTTSSPRTFGRCSMCRWLKDSALVECGVILEFAHSPLEMSYEWRNNGGKWMNMDENRWTLQNFLLFKIHEVTLAFLDCRLEAYLLRQWPTYVRTWPSTNRRVLQISDARLKMVNPDAGVSAWRVSARLTSWFGWRMTPIWMENGEMADIWWDEGWNGMNGSLVDRGESRDRLKTLSPCPRGQCGKQMRKESMVDLSYRHANVYALWRQWPFGHIWTSYVTHFTRYFDMFCMILSPSNHKAMRKWLEPWCRFVIQICDRCGYRGFPEIFG